MILAFTVYGVAQPKGSTRAFMRPGMRHPVITDDNAKGRNWQQLVAQQAAVALTALPDGDRAVLTGGVRLSVTCYLPRPKKYNRRGVAVSHLTRPDLDKLVRGVGDALKRVVWTDDAQIVELIASKHYAAIDDVPHIDVRVEPSTGSILLHAEPSLFAER